MKAPDGLDAGVEYDGQGFQVGVIVAAVEAGTTVVRTFVAVANTVLVLVVVDEDDQTPHVSDEPGLLLFPVGFTDKGVTDVTELPQGVEVEDGEVSSATGDVLEFPSQLPQDEDRAVSNPWPQDSAGVPAEAVCQSPQPPGPPRLSRLSTTLAKTELANARRTNELFTILAT